MIRKAIWSVVFAALLSGIGPLQAQMLASLPQTTAAAQTAGAARPLPAWVGFCQDRPAECHVDTSEPSTIPLRENTWQMIVATNLQVNRAIKPITDQEHWGVADKWVLPDDGSGDCEDYGLLKRKRLAEAGLPRRAMRMTVVLDDYNEGHAVLMVRTDRGDFILDNKTNAVLPWHQTGYVYIKREGQDGIAWVSLGGASSPATTANR